MTENQTPSTKSAKTVTTNLCRCGCGEATSSSKTQYKPGHDARHAGIVARDIAESASTQYMERVTADSDLGSEALIRKAHAMAERLLQKAKAPQDRKPSKAAGKKADKKATAALVAQEEAAHAAAEAEKRAAIEAELEASDDADDLAPVSTVKVGRWDYPARAARTEDGETYLVRNTKRDGSGEWVVFDPRS